MTLIGASISFEQSGSPISSGLLPDTINDPVTYVLEARVFRHGRILTYLANPTLITVSQRVADEFDEMLAAEIEECYQRDRVRRKKAET